MSISWILVSGLFLALLTTRTSASPMFRSQQNLAHLLDEEFSEYLSSEEGAVHAAGNPKARFLRDLSLNTRSKGTWARLFNDYNNPRKFRGINKKGSSKGCFGRKLDRIGAMSGLGC
ncbi:C-type natriuretic peptide 2-like [Carcharodon carcharias]|uniref:C-type natriuretic peptide 2-like n=1 Tax=Carcharodon carcharias TaxID=13397 RepID=UPI001B7E2CB7|nr:C-type natriuretic peptide 2-like [Carcharodon carcharias]